MKKTPQSLVWLIEDPDKGINNLLLLNNIHGNIPINFLTNKISVKGRAPDTCFITVPLRINYNGLSAFWKPSRTVLSFTTHSEHELGNWHIRLLQSITHYSYAVSQGSAKNFKSSLFITLEIHCFYSF